MILIGKELAFIFMFITFLAYFFISVRKNRKIRGIDDYLFYGRSLDSGGYTRTFVATGISLATVLAFFLEFGGTFGLAIILSPLTYLVGVFMLYKALPILEEEGYIRSGTTLHVFLGKTYSSESLRKITSLISILGYIGILIIEIHVGVQIFRLFTENETFLSLFAVCLILLIGIYTWLGGYQAVVDTDRLQLTLIFFATIACLFIVIFLAFTNNSFPAISKFMPFPWKLPLSLIIVMVFGNIPLQILRMSNWQRIAAVGNLAKVKTGLKNAIFLGFIFWFVFNIIGIFLDGLNIASGASFGNLKLLRIAELNIGFMSNILLPVIFVGMVAALVSTADSILVPIITSVIYDLRNYKHLHINGHKRELPDEQKRPLLNSARTALPFILLITILLYWILVKFAKFDFVSLLFVFFNQQLVLFSPVFIAFSPDKTEIRKISKLLMITIVVSWISVWITCIIGVQTANNDLIYYSALIGFGLSIIIPCSSSIGRHALASSFKRYFK